MKTLIIISHPEIAESASQQFFLNALFEQEDVTIRHLDQVYATCQIDVKKEIELLAQHERIIFQFPLYWYSSPALLKEWQDLVFSDESIRTSEGTILKDKEFGIVLSVGVKQSDYRVGGKEGMTIDELMRPYQAVARHMKMIYLPTFAVHQFAYLTEKKKKELLIDYQYYILGKRANSLAERSTWLIHQLNKIEVVTKEQDQRNKLNRVINQLVEKKELIAELEETLEDF